MTSETIKNINSEYNTLSKNQVDYLIDNSVDARELVRDYDATSINFFKDLISSNKWSIYNVLRAFEYVAEEGSAEDIRDVINIIIDYIQYKVEDEKLRDKQFSDIYNILVREIIDYLEDDEDGLGVIKPEYFEEIACHFVSKKYLRPYHHGDLLFDDIQDIRSPVKFQKLYFYRLLYGSGYINLVSSMSEEKRIEEIRRISNGNFTDEEEKNMKRYPAIGLLPAYERGVDQYDAASFEIPDGAIFFGRNLEYIDLDYNNSSITIKILDKGLKYNIRELALNMIAEYDNVTKRLASDLKNAILKESDKNLEGLMIKSQYGVFDSEFYKVCPKGLSKRFFRKFRKRFS